MLVPFGAITEFFDPSVQFNVKFEVREEAPEGEAPAEPPPPKLALAKRDDEPGRSAAGKPEPRKNEVAKIGAVKGEANVTEANPGAKLAPLKGADARKEAGREKTEASTGGEAEPSKVVSIDAFRKKP